MKGRREEGKERRKEKMSNGERQAWREERKEGRREIEME